MRIPLFLFLCLVLQAAAHAGLPVAVSVLPQKTFVQAVGGDAVEVQVVVGKGFDPATWQPTPRQLRRLSKARLYVRAGLPFEKSWLPRFRRLDPDMEVLDMRDGLALIPQESGEADPHVWTDPRQVKIHAAHLRDTLVRLDPAHRAQYEAGYEELAHRLDELDTELARRLAPLKGRAFLVFHPAWSYFARRYGLKQLSVEREGKEPSARSLARLVEQARKLGIHTLIVQPQHRSRMAQVVARELGARIVEVDPLDEDYFAAMRRMAQVLTDSAS